MEEQTGPDSPAPGEGAMHRRDLVGWGVLGVAVAASYGMGAGFAARFIYPRKTEPKMRQLFVATRDQIRPGQPFRFTDPQGQLVLVNEAGGKLQAFSSTCPHLGCRVHWDGSNQRYVCPCHNGIFDPAGQPIAGPPKAENKALTRYELVLDGPAVYILLPEA